MISLSQSRPAVSDENEQALRIYRSLAVTGAAVLPGFGIVRRLVDPHSHDPILERVSIALILLAFVVLSLVNGPVRRHPHQSIAVVIYLVSAGVIHIGAINGLSTNTAFGYLIMLFACSLVFRTRAMLAGYQISTIATVGLMVWLAPQLTIDPKFFMFSLVAVALLTFAVQANRLAAEAALREARDLAETAVEVRSRFLANVSHEIRTPMNGVVGMVSLLEDTELSGTQRDYLRTIRTSSDSLLLLINDILDFSKLEAGYVELESTAFDLVACVEDAVEVVAPAAREKGLELLCECAPSVPGRVVGDSLRLRQVLVNLLSNAVKFTPRGEVLVYLWGRSEGARGWRARCTVRDTGIGIDAGCVDGLFEAFAQADSSTTRRFGGTGLGLSICRQLAERMGGSIRVESRLGQGAAFHFDVLLDCEPDDLAAAPVPAAAAGTRVLVLEPHAATRAALARLLESWGAVCAVPADEAAGRAALTGESFDLVLAGCSGDRLAALRGAAGPGCAASRYLRLAPMAETPQTSADGDRVLYRPLRRAALRAAVEAAAAATSAGPAAQGTSVTAPSPSSDDTPLRILLVEDNPVNQRVAMTMLERLGHDAVLAGDGAEALRAVRGGRFDVVLMDLQMPVMDGLEATRRIRREPDGQALRIVAMTANAMTEDREACRDAGMDGCLCKPVKLEELRSLLTPGHPAVV